MTSWLVVTSVDARGDSTHRKNGFLKKMINGSVLSELILLWFASVYGAASSIQNCVLPLVLRLQKVQERSLCKTYILTTSHLAGHMLQWKWQFLFGNIRKITKNSNFKRHFLEISWSYRRKILHDNLEDIKPNDIFQNYVHSTSTLRITFEPWLFGLSYFTFTCLVTRSRSLTLYHYWYAPGMDF